jgi:hypothetical protein
MTKITPRTFRLVCLLALALISHALYASMVPPWQAPDEPAHFEVAELIHANGRLVTPADRGPGLQPDIVASLDRNKFFQYIPWAIRDHVIQAYQFQQPPLYYILAAFTWWVAPGQSIENQLLFMRFLSVVMNLGMVALAMFTMERLEPQDEFLQWTVPAFVGLLPMSTFISSTVNNDNLANLVAAAAVLVATDYLMCGARARDILAFLFFVPLAALSKRSALIVMPIGFIAVVFAHLKPAAWRRITPRRAMVAFVLPIVLLVVLILLAASSEPVMAQARSIYQRLTYTSNVPALADLVQAEADRVPVHAVAIFTSFWGAFGWETIHFPIVAYWLLLGLSGLAVLGFLRYYLRAVREHVPQASVLGLYVLIPLFLFVAVALAFGLYDTDPANLWWGKGAPGQGRYLFPGLIPLATILMIGVRELIPSRFRRPVTALTVAALAAFNLASLFLVILPYFNAL